MERRSERRAPFFEQEEEVKREKDIERRLVAEIRKNGGLCLKFISPGWSGAPDRICLWPDGEVVFVELKRPGGKVRPLQERRAEQLHKLGFEVLVVDSTEKIKELFNNAEEK